MDDDCSLHEVKAVLNHLDSLKAVHNVYFTERPPATAADIHGKFLAAFPELPREDFPLMRLSKADGFGPG